jgi:hypothetical protein
LRRPDLENLKKSYHFGENCTRFAIWTSLASHASGEFMLTIRHTQMAVFQREADRRLGVFLTATMARSWPRICNALPAEHLARLCDDAVRDCRSWKIRSDQSIARFLSLRFALGERFPLGDPEAQAILADTATGEQQRLNEVLRRLRQRRSVDGAAM